MKITSQNINDVFASKKASIDTMEKMGYELIKELFVDNSGLGEENEPALTRGQFIKEVEKLITEHGALTSKITSEGQFQVYVGFFKKTGKSTMRKIAGNTYKIETADGYTIRFHDTDIITLQADGMKLNNGGYMTATTKRRINEHLPAGYVISQKNFEWFLVDMKSGKITPFINGMIIKK